MPGKSDTSQGTLSAARNAHLRQFIRYSIVGVVQNGVNIGVFAIAVAGGVPFLLASVLAAVVALTVSFFLNRRWTFPGRTDQTTARAIRFVSIWITILLMGLLLLAALVDLAHLPKVLAQAIVVVVGAPLSYTAQRRWTFADRVKPTRAPT
jgi:putative flippase GtrA